MPEGSGQSAAERPTRYSRAPILEAVIDIRARLPDDITVQALSIAPVDEAGTYSVRQKRYLGNILFQDAQPPVLSAEQTHIGFVFRDDERNQVVQFRLDGFAFSKLAPYESWEPFCRDARVMWERYCESAHPLGVTRVAVRYVNRFDLPLPLVDFREYLRTHPEVSPNLPQGLSGFLLQLQIPQGDIADGMLILNQGLLESPNPHTASVLLDIDLFRPVVLPVHGSEVWEALEELHQRKNSVFEACITEKTRELIR